MSVLSGSWTRGLIPFDRILDLVELVLELIELHLDLMEHVRDDTDIINILPCSLRRRLCGVEEFAHFSAGKGWTSLIRNGICLALRLADERREKQPDAHRVTHEYSPEFRLARINVQMRSIMVKVKSG